VAADATAPGTRVKGLESEKRNEYFKLEGGEESFSALKKF
jgi:hypothetical protein